MKIKVSVPATSANVGSGFDALGLAVTLYNTVTFEDSEVLPSAIAKMRSALGELVIEGITTNVDFQYELIGDRDFEDGNVDTDFIPSHFPDC